jgi:hypothetical protein
VGWPILGIIAILGSCGYMGIRALWPFKGSYSEDLVDAGFPKTEIQETTGPMGGKTQVYYIARPKVGACTFKLVKKQFENGYSLTEVNGEDVPGLANPTKDEAVAHAAKSGINCNK